MHEEAGGISQTKEGIHNTPETKKTESIEKEGVRLAEMAEKDPFQSLRTRQPRFPTDVPMEIWEAHIKTTVSQKETRSQYIRQENYREPCPYFTEEEVEGAISSLKVRKAPGPDGICNEHLKEAHPVLAKVWLALFNKCLEKGEIPHEWRKSTIKMLYKGKGDPSTPDAYRGVALEQTAFKVFTKLIAGRICPLLEEHLPDEQFGFRRGRSTQLAAECLIHRRHK